MTDRERTLSQALEAGLLVKKGSHYYAPIEGGEEGELQYVARGKSAAMDYVEEHLADPEAVALQPLPPPRQKAAAPVVLHGHYVYSGPRRDYDLPAGGRATLYPGSHYHNLPAASPVIRDALQKGHLKKL